MFRVSRVTSWAEGGSDRTGEACLERFLAAVDDASEVMDGTLFLDEEDGSIIPSGAAALPQLETFSALRVAISSLSATFSFRS